MANESRYDILIRTDAELAGLQQSQAELKGLAEAAKASGRSADALEAELASVDQRIGQRKVDLYTQGLREMVDQERAAGRETSVLEQRLRGLESATTAAAKEGTSLGAVFGGSFLGGLASNAVTSAAQNVQQLIGNAIELADTLQDLSDRSGIAASAIQTIGNAAVLNGGSLSGAADGLNKITISAQQAVSGSKPLLESFGRLGITVQELRELRPDQLFLSIADGVATSTDRGRAYADVVTVMGRGSSSLFATLEQGGETIRKTGEEFGVFSDRTIKELSDAKGAIEEFQNQLTILAGKSISFLNQSLQETSDRALFEFSRALGMSSEQIAQFSQEGARLSEALDLLKPAVGKSKEEVEGLDTATTGAAAASRALAVEAANASGEVDGLGVSAESAADRIKRIDAAFAERSFDELPLALKASELQKALEKLRAEADKELPGIRFGEAADLNVIANGLAGDKAQDRVKALALEMGKIEDALKAVTAEQGKVADAAKRAAEEQNKGLDSELGKLKEKLHLLEQLANPTKPKAASEQSELDRVTGIVNDPKTDAQDRAAYKAVQQKLAASEAELVKSQIAEQEAKKVPTFPPALPSPTGTVPAPASGTPPPAPATPTTAPSSAGQREALQQVSAAAEDAVAAIEAIEEVATRGFAETAAAATRASQAISVEAPKATAAIGEVEAATVQGMQAVATAAAGAAQQIVAAVGPILKNLQAQIDGIRRQL